jgi:hypothetical protein
MDKREHAAVRVPPGGVVADYVPFYFGPKSPMLYAIKQGKVEGYQGQKEIIYLVTTAEAVAAQNLSFMFTDGHGIISYVNHYNQLADLPKYFGMSSTLIIGMISWTASAGGRPSFW